MVAAPDSTDFLLQDALKQALFLDSAEWIAWHKVTDSWVRCQRVYLLRVHSFPEALILEVPLSIDNPFIRLDVCKETFIVENAANSAVESMHSWVIARKLSTCETFPEIYVLFALGIRRLASQNPSVRTFTVSPDNNIGI